MARPNVTSEDSGLRIRLVQQALDLLETTGEVPSLRAVARAAGISAMTPYSYFEDKAALMRAVADRGLAIMVTKLEAANQQANPAEALVAQCVTYVAFATDNPALFRLICSNEYGHAQARSAAGSRDILEQRVADLIPAQVPAATLACRSLVQGLAAIVLDRQLGSSSAAEIDGAIRLLVDGFVAVSGRSTSRV